MLAEQDMACRARAPPTDSASVTAKKKNNHVLLIGTPL